MKYIPILLVAASLAICPGCKLFNGNSKPEVQKIENTAKWIYGGVNGSGFQCVGNLIGNLNATGNNMSYSWIVSETEAVQLLGSKEKTEADLLACFFVTTTSGEVVGGKFEWISVSRKTRQFGNILVKKYQGWSLANVPNPTKVYFCIANPKNGKRTNFIEGTWQR